MYAFCYIPIVDGSSPLALAGSFLLSIYIKVIKKFCRQMQTISRSAQKSSKSRKLAELCEWWAASLPLKAGCCWPCVPCVLVGERQRLPGMFCCALSSKGLVVELPLVRQQF